MSEVSRGTGNSLTILKIGKVYDFNPDSGIDLRAIFNELHIYMSIKGMITSGDVIVTEQGNLVSSLPIEGTEYIEVAFRTTVNNDTSEAEYEEFHRVFFVYAVDNIVEGFDKRTYCIRFVDAMGLINNDTRFAVRYTNKFEDIIDNIAKVINDNTDNVVYETVLNNLINQRKSFVYETNDPLLASTSYPMSFVSPYWKPLRLMSYLSERAVSSDSVSIGDKRFCDCFFFQSMTGKFIFTNYKKMFTNQLRDFKNNKVVFEKRIGNISGDNVIKEEPKYGIVNYNIPRIFDIQSQKINGMFGFTDNIVDFLRVMCKPDELEKSDILDIINTYNLDIESNYTPYEAINYTPNSLFIYNEAEIDRSASDDNLIKFIKPFEKSIPVRKLLENSKITLAMNGVSDIDLGRFVMIDLGEADTQSSSESFINYVKKAKWIISTITHTFNENGDFSTYVECFTPFFYRDKPNESH